MEQCDPETGIGQREYPDQYLEHECGKHSPIVLFQGDAVWRWIEC